MTPHLALTERRPVVASARYDRLALERGQEATMAHDGFVMVTSATSDARYLVEPHVLPSGRIVQSCDHPIELGYSSSPLVSVPGCTACTHQAAAARLLERLGQARWTGLHWEAAR